MAIPVWLVALSPGPWNLEKENSVELSGDLGGHGCLMNSLMGDSCRPCPEISDQEHPKDDGEESDC